MIDGIKGFREVKKDNISLDLVYERPDPEVVESYSAYVRELQENSQVTHEFARKYIEQSFESMRKRYDVNSAACIFNEGDQVWLYNPRKKQIDTICLCIVSRTLTGNIKCL